MKKVINLNKWVSQSFLAKKLGVATSRVTTWVHRKRIDSIYVEELGATLVRNILSINELRKNSKKER